MTTDPASTSLLPAQPSPSSSQSPSPSTWGALSNRKQYQRKVPAPAPSYGTAAAPFPEEHTPVHAPVSSYDWLDLLLRIRIILHLPVFPLIVVMASSLTWGRNIYSMLNWGLLLVFASYGTFDSSQQLRLYRKQELTWKQMRWTSLLRATIWMPLLAYDAWVAIVLAVSWFRNGGEGRITGFAGAVAFIVAGLVATEVGVGGVAFVKMRQERWAERAEL